MMLRRSRKSLSANRPFSVLAFFLYCKAKTRQEAGDGSARKPSMRATPLTRGVKMGVMNPRRRKEEKISERPTARPSAYRSSRLVPFLSISSLFGIKRFPRLPSAPNQQAIVFVHPLQLGPSCNRQGSERHHISCHVRRPIRSAHNDGSSLDPVRESSASQRASYEAHVARPRKRLIAIPIYASMVVSANS